MTLPAWEARVAIEGCIQITSKDVLNLSRGDDVFRFCIWQLNPIMQQVCGDPEHKLVNACSPDLKVSVVDRFFTFCEDAGCDPIVVLGSIDFAAEVNTISTTHNRQPLE